MMSLRMIQPDRAYIAGQFQCTATVATVSIYEAKPDIKWVNETIFSRQPEWQELLIKQEQVRRAEQKAYDNDLAPNGDSETVLIEESGDDSTFECRMPTESELREARLMNIPTRGFCVSADIEKITAESYRYLYDPEEFKTPDI